MYLHHTCNVPYLAWNPSNKMVSGIMACESILRATAFVTRRAYMKHALLGRKESYLTTELRDNSFFSLKPGLWALVHFRQFTSELVIKQSM
jgi:hypothetical protein